jgi:hypothetical protein
MVSPRLSRLVSRTISRLLYHKYTRTTFTDTGNVDDNNQPIYTTNAPVSGVSCLLLWADVSTTDERGTSIEKRPRLYVLPDDPLKEGDLVSSVLDRSQAHTLLSRARVKTVNPAANFGDSVIRICELEGYTL